MLGWILRWCLFHCPRVMELVLSPQIVIENSFYSMSFDSKNLQWNLGIMFEIHPACFVHLLGFKRRCIFPRPFFQWCFEGLFWPVRSMLTLWSSQKSCSCIWWNLGWFWDFRILSRPNWHSRLAMFTLKLHETSRCWMKNGVQWKVWRHKFKIQFDV